MKILALIFVSMLALTLTARAQEAAIPSPTATPPAAASPDNARTLWLYYQYANLGSGKNVDELEQIMHRASKAGYRYILLLDPSVTGKSIPDSYAVNVRRIKKLADELGLEIAPRLFNFGFSNAMLAIDPNLAEGMSVTDALFVVKNNQAALEPDPAVSLLAGDMADLSKWGVKANNPSITLDNGAVRIGATGEAVKIAQKVKVHPFRQYHLSFRMKTQAVKGGSPRVFIYSTGEKPRRLDYQEQVLNVNNSDWKEYHQSFNSQSYSEVEISLGLWRPQSGAAWFDDVKFEEVGLVNLVRRPGAPLTVKIDGGRQLVEGTDFQPLSDPKLGNDGEGRPYEAYHQPPLIQTKGLPDGTRLRVSYYHAHMENNGQVMICPSEPKTRQLMAEQAKRVNDLWHANKYFMGYDEIRVLNQDKACQDRFKTAGQVLADSARYATKCIRDVAPNARVYIFSDMFDPNHNAVNNYWLVKGDLAGAWEGLDPSVNVMCWQYKIAAQSVKFFLDRGNDVTMAGYYNQPVDENAAIWLGAAGDSPKVKGIMYTTFKHDFTDLEKFAQAVKTYKPGQEIKKAPATQASKEDAAAQKTRKGKTTPATRKGKPSTGIPEDELK